MKISIEQVESFLNSLGYRYEKEVTSISGKQNVEIRLFNQESGEHSARIEFIDGYVTKVDYWDKEKKTIETVSIDSS